MKLIIIILVHSMIMLSAWGATVRISPVSQQTLIDSLVKVTVRVDCIENLHAYSLKISYSPAMVRCSRIQKGTIFSAGNSFFFNSIDSVQGIISIDEALLGLQSISDSGTLVTISFIGKQAGRVNLLFTTADFRDTSNTSLDISSIGGELNINTVTGIDDVITNIPKQIIIQNYPNPFNSTTIIRITIPVTPISTITIVSIEGKIINMLSMSSDGAGGATTSWDGTDFNGNPVASGMYFARLITHSTIQYRKLILLK